MKDQLCFLVLAGQRGYNPTRRKIPKGLPDVGWFGGICGHSDFWPGKPRRTLKW